MTRQPDIKSQTKSIVLKAKTIEQEKAIDDAKRLAIQDGILLNDLMFEAVHLVFKVHHWPPGNPQLTLPKFANGQPKIELGKCGYANCSNKAVIIGVYLPQNKEYKLCEKHRQVAKADSKNWSLKEQENKGGYYW